MGPVESALLAAVEPSPRATPAHDRAGWVELFTSDGRVEDPVGSWAHVGPVQISRFYDAFIGPHGIAFHRNLDVIRGSTVVRDLELEVATASAITMTIPAFLRYDLREVNDEWKITIVRLLGTAEHDAAVACATAHQPCPPPSNCRKDSSAISG